MKLTEGKITTIIYEKDSGEKSSRVIIPVQVPKDLIRAIDLSDVEPDQREAVAKLYEEYAEYKARYLSNMFNFETWADHTYGAVMKPAWRSFKTSGLR
jgi:hypothetical protein